MKIKNLIFILMATLPLNNNADDQRAAIDALLDGLHQDAHDGYLDSTLTDILLTQSF